MSAVATGPTNMEGAWDLHVLYPCAGRACAVLGWVVRHRVLRQAYDRLVAVEEGGFLVRRKKAARAARKRKQQLDPAEGDKEGQAEGEGGQQQEGEGGGDGGGEGGGEGECHGRT